MARKIGDNTRPVMLTADAARRIGRAVQAYEQGRSRVPPRTLRVGGDDGGQEIRMGSVSGAWDKNTTKTVTRLQGDGTAWVPEQTFDAVNHFSDLSDICPSRKVACALVGTTWVLIAAECD